MKSTQLFAKQLVDAQATVCLFAIFRFCRAKAAYAVSCAASSQILLPSEESPICFAEFALPRNVSSIWHPLLTTSCVVAGRLCGPRSNLRNALYRSCHRVHFRVSLLITDLHKVGPAVCAHQRLRPVGTSTVTCTGQWSETHCEPRSLKIAQLALLEVDGLPFGQVGLTLFVPDQIWELVLNVFARHRCYSFSHSKNVCSNCCSKIQYCVLIPLQNV